MADTAQHDDAEEIVQFITWLRLVAVLNALGEPHDEAQQHAYVEIYGPASPETAYAH